MKILSFLFLICTIHSDCYPQGTSGDKKAAIMLNEFYVAHANIWSIFKTFPPDVFDQKLDSLQRKYCTAKLRNEAKKYIRDGFDLMTDDKGINLGALKTMTIVKDTTAKDIYLVSYDRLVNNGPPNSFVKRHVILSVGVVLVDENYKIASVN